MSVVRSQRGLIALNSLLRLAYGAGALLRPSAMVPLRLAPDTDDRPEARLFIRGFGAHQLVVAALGLASLRCRGLRGPAMTVAVAIDASDLVTVAVESRARGRIDEDLAGGIAISAAGAITAAAALGARG